MAPVGRPSPQWPLVGRAGELRLLTSLLSRRDTSGLVLAGPPGVGKTRLALEGLLRAEQLGMATARVSASRAAAELPFGAVAPLLPAESWPEAASGGVLDRANLLRRFGSALSERAEGRRLVLLVDDAHLLDDASATLVYQLAGSGTTLVLATVRTGEPAPDPVLALWKDGLLERLEVSGLDGQTVDALLTAALGGPVNPSAVVRLTARCQGNVLFLRELVLGALELGALINDGGMWCLAGPLAASRRLVELVEARLGGIGDRERALLEAVALGEPLSAAELDAVAGVAEAESLERAGLLVSTVDGRRLEFHLAHPLHGEVLRQGISRLRQRGIARTLAVAVESTGARRGGDLLRVATWRLDAGGATPELLLAAAATAGRGYDLALAERFIRAALLDGAGFPAAVEAARLASLRGRGEDAEAELTALSARAGDDLERGVLAVARVDNLRLMGRFDDALTVAGEADLSTGVAAACRDDLAARRAGLLLDTVGPMAAAEAAESLCASAQGGALLLGCLYAALALSRTGRLDAAASAALRGHDASTAVSTDAPRWPVTVLTLARAEALAHAGGLAEAEELAEAEHAQALAEGSVDAQAYAAWQLAKILVAQGRADTAARHGREAGVLLRQLGRRVLLRDCLVPLALAEALRGEAGAAIEVLKEIDALGLAPSGWTGVDLLCARAWAAVAEGDTPAGRHLLEEASTLGARIGDRVGETVALHDRARLGFAREVASRLVAVAADIDGDLAPARAAHATALTANDPEALEVAYGTFEGLGALLLAAEAAADAAVAWRRRGDGRRSAAAQRRASSLSGRCEGAVTPALQGIETRGLLTPAERLVAQMAAAGRSNRDIAAELYLSVRTVENRLHRIYDKLGIAGRADLAAALQE